MDLQQPQNKLLEEQDEPYTLENIPVTISIQHYKVSLQSCIMQIKEDSYSILIEKPNDEWVTLYSSFKNTTSVGISGGTNLLIFVGDVEQDDLQEEPEILQLMREGKPCNLNLMGHSFLIELSLEKQGKNVAVEVNDIFAEYMGDADEHHSLYDENEDFQQMISAEDIDQNGNIIKNSKKEQSEQSEQSEEDGQKMQEQVRDMQKK